MGCGPRNVDTCAGVAVLLLRCVRGCEKPAWLAVPALRPSSRTRESAPRAPGPGSPDRLCIPSRAASHRLNVKVGKNVYNHDARRSAEKRTSRSFGRRGAGAGERTEEAPRGAAGAGPRTGRTSKRGRRRVRPRPAGAARNVREDRRERWRRRGPATRWCDRWCGLPSAALHATGPGRCGCAPYCDSGLRRSEHGLVGCRLAVSPQKPIPGRGWCWEYR